MLHLLKLLYQADILNKSNNNRMLASGFSNAPLSKYLIMAVVAASLVATITDSKHLFWIMVKPHISDYRQLWRCMTWPLLYTNSTEVLFSAMTLYQLRIIERLWGSRKFAVCSRNQRDSHHGRPLLIHTSRSFSRHYRIPFFSRHFSS